MSRQRDRILPIAAFLVLAAVGLLVLLLVNEASTGGRRALEQSLVGEVEAIARSQNSRVVSQLTGGSGLAADNWDLQPASEGDLDAPERDPRTRARPPHRLLPDRHRRRHHPGRAARRPRRDRRRRTSGPGSTRSSPSRRSTPGPASCCPWAAASPPTSPRWRFVYPDLRARRRRSARHPGCIRLRVGGGTRQRLQRRDRRAPAGRHRRISRLRPRRSHHRGQRPLAHRRAGTRPGLPRRRAGSAGHRRRRLRGQPTSRPQRWRIAFTQDRDEFLSGLDRPVAAGRPGRRHRVPRHRRCARLRAHPPAPGRARGAGPSPPLAETQEEFISIVSPRAPDAGGRRARLPADHAWTTGRR